MPKLDKLITLEQLQIVSKNKQKQITSNANAIAGIKDGTVLDSFSDVELALMNKLGSVESVTYAELTSLKNSSHLIPGQYYRITDYVTTTSQTGTQSAGHQFDIIIMALTNNSLSEDAYADKHEGDTYFTNNDLTKWKLKYCLENDTTRFDWADTTNGKGVIFRLIDENLNDLPYDFKNIQFARYKITAVNDENYSAFVGKYFGFSGALGTTIDNTDYKYYYTFNLFENNEIVDNYDLSIQNVLNPSFSNSKYVKQVTIKEYLNDSPNYRGIKSLNNFVIASGNIIVDIRFDYGSYANTIIVVQDFTYNYFHTMSRNNLLWTYVCSHNTIRECFQQNLVLCFTDSGQFSHNTILKHFQQNYCRTMHNNHLGMESASNKFANIVRYVSIDTVKDCDFRCLAEFSYSRGTLWRYVICENANSLKYLDVHRMYKVNIKNRGLGYLSSIFLQNVTFESQNINSENLEHIRMISIVASSSTPVRIVYDNAYLPIPIHSPLKEFDIVNYTDGTTTTIYYTVTWQEFDGTNFVSKKYYSTDKGLTWTLAN